jgi:hypothetical protein
MAWPGMAWHGMRWQLHGMAIAWHRQVHPHLELTTSPSLGPVSLSLSMDGHSA